MSEADEMRSMMLAASSAGARVFRNNVALAWAGEADIIKRPRTVRVGPGDVVIRNARPLHAGLCKGSSDLIGWNPVVIRQFHVGRTLAIFTAIEAKAPGGRRSKEQKNFIEQVERAGGLCGVAYDVPQALKILAKHES